MAKVVVTTPKGVIGTKQERNRVGLTIASAVANQLHVEEKEDFHLTYHKVEVIFEHRHSDAMVNGFDIEIEIFAHHCDERAANLREKVKSVIEQIKDVIEEHVPYECESRFVEISLSPGAFIQF